MRQRVIDMANTEIGPIFEEIGRLVARDVGEDPEGAFLYAEGGDGWIEAAIFKDMGDRVVYRDASTELFDKLGEVWEAEEPDKRWAALQYTISGGRFACSMQYPDDLAPEEITGDRRRTALRALFGDKPIDYSDP